MFCGALSTHVDMSFKTKDISSVYLMQMFDSRVSEVLLKYLWKSSVLVELL